MHVFRHDDGRTIVRSEDAWRVPAAIAPLVDVVKGVSDFPLRTCRGRVMGVKDISPQCP